MIQIYDFTVPELDRFRELCNFSEQELLYFNLRAKHYSNTKIAFEMNLSVDGVSKVAKKVKSKMLRII